MSDDTPAAPGSVDNSESERWPELVRTFKEHQLKPGESITITHEKPYVGKITLKRSQRMDRKPPIVLISGGALLWLLVAFALFVLNPTATIFLSGGAFLTLLIALALFVPNPTGFQYTVFRVILSLAAAGFAGPIPGFITAKIPNYVEAGGALAVFVLVYYFNPAALVATSRR